MKLGCCYYPEHWPEAMWADDAKRMAALGLTYVRIGEFAWSRIEPKPGQFDWDWLDRAVEALSDAGLKIIMGTPTATPPKWLIDAHPDILPCDAYGRPRKFGSRRHYSFSSVTYRYESARIVEALARRYGNHPAVVMWQTDNEYGCHDTVTSNDPNAALEFREWLEERYGGVDRLNEAWGTVFWSQGYRFFAEIDPPLGTVTEANPSHVLDWQRFSSDQVARYNSIQTQLLRRYSPGRDITHNFMGHFTEFDHYPVGKQIDISTWDSYPLGFLEEAWWDRDTKIKYAHTGHPDFAGFHHDLYRGMSAGRWGVMEQQPGPVNWAKFNPSPADGMVTLWTLEAAAHGAEFVSYFRWRQVPFAQEQMHAGLNRADNIPDKASDEAAEALRALGLLGELGGTCPADAALIFDYEAVWICETQPQGDSFNYAELAFNFYTALRRIGLNVDIVSPYADLENYEFVVIPSLPHMRPALEKQLLESSAQLLIGPRTGSKTQSLNIPAKLAPGGLRDLLGLKIVRVESLRDGVDYTGDVEAERFTTRRWREEVETDLIPAVCHDDGSPAMIRNRNAVYLPVWPDRPLLDFAIKDCAQTANLPVRKLSEGLRLRRRGDLVFAFNYGDNVDLTEQGLVPDAESILYGSPKLSGAKLAIWRD